MTTDPPPGDSEHDPMPPLGAPPVPPGWVPAQAAPPSHPPAVWPWPRSAGVAGEPAPGGWGGQGGWGGGPGGWGGQGPWWGGPGPYPQAPWEEPLRPRRSAGRRLLAVIAVGAMLAGGIVAWQRVAPDLGLGGTAGVTQGVVDITTTLADGSGQAAGTGMVLTSSGEVLTNNHVIAGESSITVTIGGTGPTRDATLEGTDPAADVALLQIQDPPSGLQTVRLGDSSTVRVGQAVTAVGNALGRQGAPSVVQGTVTALDRSITASDDSGSSENLSGLIQVNARIVPGDSGGPLLDDQGRVIGMDTAASSRSRRFSATTVGFAIPINTAMSVVHRLESQAAAGTPATARRPIIGVTIDPSAAQTSGSGVPINGVQAGGPADQAGLRAGDLIVSIDGTPVQSASDLQDAIRAHHPGDTVTVTWDDTSGQEHSASVRLAEGPPG